MSAPSGAAALGADPASMPATGLHPALEPVWEAVVKATRLSDRGFREHCRVPGMADEDGRVAFEDLKLELRGRRQRAYAALQEISAELWRRDAQNAALPTGDSSMQKREAEAAVEAAKLRAHVAHLRREVEDADRRLERAQGDLAAVPLPGQAPPARLGHATRHVLDAAASSS